MELLISSLGLAGFSLFAIINGTIVGVCMFLLLNEDATVADAIRYLKKMFK